MIGLSVSDYSALHWESDWNGYEVGHEAEVVGLYKVPQSESSPELYLYVDMETNKVLEVWTLEDAEDEVDGYEEFDPVDEDLESADAVLGDWWHGTWTPGGGAEDDSAPVVTPVEFEKVINIAGIKIAPAENGGVWVFLGGSTE